MFDVWGSAKEKPPPLLRAVLLVTLPHNRIKQRIEKKGGLMISFVSAMYVGINLGSAIAAVVAGLQWWRSAQAAYAGNQADSMLHNAKAAYAACLAAIFQAAIAGHEFTQSVLHTLGIQ
jgi:hypothetical protein